MNNYVLVAFSGTGMNKTAYLLTECKDEHSAKILYEKDCKSAKKFKEQGVGDTLVALVDKQFADKFENEHKGMVSFDSIERLKDYIHSVFND